MTLQTFRLDGPTFLLVAFRHLTYVLYIERFQSERVSLNAQAITSSLLVRLTNALTAVLRLASQTPP